MSPEEEAYASALTRAIAADIAAHPPNGELVRFVLRWFLWDDPLHIMLHVLGSDDDDQGEPWYPLEWSNLDEELARTDRVTSDPDVHRAAKALGPYYAERKDEIPDEHPASPAIKAVIRRLPDAIASVPSVAHFAATASHFEAYGMLDTLVASAHALAELEARDELPPDD
jgi:hypothetical protein